MKINKDVVDHIMRIDCDFELKSKTGEPVTGIETKLSLLFNDTVISKEEVLEVLLKSKHLNKDPRIIIATQEQVKNLLGGNHEKSDQ